MTIEQYELDGDKINIYFDNGEDTVIEQRKFLYWIEESEKLNWHNAIGLYTETWGTYKRWEYFEVYDRAEIEEHLMEYLQQEKILA